ncbi:glycoside hydrolase N-terminal domain-containing protein [Brachybacterium sp. GCM10030268]|uniref:glycosyl hydrolase family 95 catalytic domain-containing protein n=1 Tax=Brachybacterium sp. GCM10030268 TaxID=3273382 RepID=UPI00360A029C
MTPPDTLSRRHAATRWLEALPLGNGRIGAMVWGDPEVARFSLNETTLWSGSPSTTRNRCTSREDAAELLTRARSQFGSGQIVEAQNSIEELGAAWAQAYQPVGDLQVRLSRADGTQQLVERTLDLTRFEHTARTPDGEHRTFVSTADEVLVHSAPCPDGADVALEFTSPLVEERRTSGPDGLTLVLRAPSDGVPTRHGDVAELAWDAEDASRAAVAVRTRRERGRILVVCAIVTTWQGMGRHPDRPLADALAEATGQADAAVARGELDLRSRHLERLPLGAGDVELELGGSEHAELLATTFAYGRYLLASSSRPGLPPANLQGIWNPHVLAPWNSNYTVNINLEMNHWAAGVAHVPGAAGALEGYVAMLRESGSETARRVYGADGWTVHHNSDPWGYTDPVRGNPKWSSWPMGGLWLERELSSIAAFGGEQPRSIAERRFPALRDAAAFALDLLWETEGGELVTFPSTSPENEWVAPGGTPVGLSEGTGMDRWLVREIFELLIAASRLTGRGDDEIVRRAEAALDRVPGPRTGADGRILEWHADGLEEVEPEHRHVSHLGFLYPGTDPVPDELSRAAAASLEARGDEATGWSLVWKTCLWARLRRPDRVQALLELYLRPAETADGVERSGLYPNLFSAHPPFQIDGNIGIVAALAECLLQSHRGEIELLPALPPIMADGSVRGLRARPGIEVGMTWADADVTALHLRAVGPGALGTHTVRRGERLLDVELRDERPVEIDLSRLI